MFTDSKMGHFLGLKKSPVETHSEVQDLLLHVLAVGKHTCTVPKAVDGFQMVVNEMLGVSLN